MVAMTLKKPMTKQNKTSKKQKESDFTRGFVLGKKQSEKYAKLGKAIVDCLYEFFEPVKEDY